MTAESGRGFALVELLVTLVVTGILMAGVYNLYLQTQQSAMQQEEIVELQQNLRIAIDQLSRELRMAGFLVSRTYPPLAAAPQYPVETQPLVIRSASPNNCSAQLAAEVRVTHAGAQNFPLSGASMVELFEVGDQVRLVRPADQSQPIDRTFQVVGTNRTAKTINLAGFMAADTAVYQKGDLVLRCGPTYPGTVTFYLKENELFRKFSDGSAQRVTAKTMAGSILRCGLISFELSYLLDDGRTLSMVSGGDLSAVRGVRVALVGQLRGSGGEKLRSLANTIYLRNHRI